MGNLFIGFPVPRAKIAEMIEGSAPPLLHAYTHEPGGDDVITLPAAGITTLYDDLGFHFKTFFPTIDGFQTTLVESGAVDPTHQYLLLTTGETTASSVKVQKATMLQNPVLTFDKDIFIRFPFMSNVWDDTDPFTMVIVGDEKTHKHFGIAMYYSRLGWTMHDGSTLYGTGMIGDLVNGEDYEYIVEIKFYAGVKIEFLIDGEILHTQTDNLPSGEFYDEHFLTLYAENADTTREINMALSMLELYQPAT